MSQIRDPANSDRTLDRRVDSRPGEVQAMLERHRIATLLPLELVDVSHRRWPRAQHLEAGAAQLRVRSRATRVVELLDDATIETRVRKGLATAELNYPSHQLRHTGKATLLSAPWTSTAPSRS